MRALAASRSTIEQRRVRRGHGLVGLGQVDADEHPRLPRSADVRARTRSPGARCRGLTQERARRGPQPARSASSSRTSTCSRARAPSRTSSCRSSTPACAARAARAARARRSSGSASATASTITRTSSRAASSSAWRSRARSSTSPKVILADEPTGNLDSQHEHRGHGALPGARHARGSRSSSSRTSPTSPSSPSRVVVVKDGRIGPTSAARRSVVGLQRRAQGGRHEPARRRSASRCARSLRNKMRSFLTTLGIIIGVGAVIAMVAIGAGAKARVEQAFAAMGTNLLIVLPGSTSAGGVQRRLRLACRRSPGTISRPSGREVPDGEGRRAGRCARTSRSSARTELDDQRHRHDARVLRHPQLADRSRRARFTQPTSTAAPRSSCSGRPSSTSCSARTPTPSARRCASADIPFKVVGVASTQGPVAERAGLRRRRLHPGHDLRAQDPGRASASTSPGTIFVERDARRTRRRARRRTSPRCCAIATTSRRSGDDDFSIRNLSRDRRRAAAGHRHDDDAARERRGGVAPRRRHRDHEHHAGQRHRADARDRRAHGASAPSRCNILAQFLDRGARRSRSPAALIGVALGRRHRARWLAARFGWPMLVQPDVIALVGRRSARSSGSSSGSTPRGRRRSSIRSTRSATSSGRTRRAPPIEADLHAGSRNCAPDVHMGWRGTRPANEDPRAFEVALRLLAEAP